VIIREYSIIFWRRRYHEYLIFSKCSRTHCSVYKTFGKGLGDNNYGNLLLDRRYRGPWTSCLPNFSACKTGDILMTVNGILQIGLYLVVLLALVKPLGIYMAKVYLAGPSGSISFSVTSSG